MQALELQAGYYGIPLNQDTKKWLGEILEELGLSSKANANMRALSGGMKRRVLIAQALVHRPKVLILDEPTAGVDVELRQTLWRFVKKLHAQGTTIILTTHYLEEAQEMCNRLAVLKKGELIALENTCDLLNRTQLQHVIINFKTQINHIDLKQKYDSSGINLLTQNIQQITENTLKIAVKSTTDSLQLLNLLPQENIASFDIEKASLETVFLQLTSHSGE
jgi:ABC-2 type transport system ATP-binding protein